MSAARSFSPADEALPASTDAPIFDPVAFGLSPEAAELAEELTVGLVRRAYRL